MATNEDSGVEDSAARETHNVVQKTKRSAQGAILIVDFRIHMPPICRRNHPGGRLIVRFRPPPNFDFRSSVAFRLVAVQWQRHETAAHDDETLLHKRMSHLARFMHQQLRLDAMNARGLLQSLDHMREQPRFHFVGIFRSGRRWRRKGLRSRLCCPRKQKTHNR